MEWISVKDRLPKEGRVLIYSKETGDISTGSYIDIKENWLKFTKKGAQWVSPTHWMPVPLLPIEEEDNE